MTWTPPTTTAPTPATTSTSPLGVMTGKNIGDLLNARGVSWGWFQGGFAPTSTNSAGLAVCGATHANIGGSAVADYSPHHNPFEYYKSTANPKHLPPSSEAAIGHTDQANHQYDLSDFATTLKDGNMPSVSFLKAAGVPGRPPRLLRPAGRADVPGEHDQPDRAVQVLVVHRDRDHLRRLRRLVRPRQAGDRERLRHRAGRRHLLRGASRRWATPRTGAATASGCRCW